MKKRKIALFVNAWDADNVDNFINGLVDAAPANTTDFFVFLGHEAYSYSPNERKAEMMIYTLPDLTKFDAIIVCGASIGFDEARTSIYERAVASGVPTISIGIDWPGTYSILADNSAGMWDLCDHLVKVHNVKKVKYIAGSPDNEDSRVRMEAISKYMHEAGYEFSEENDVYYSFWETGEIGAYMQYLFSQDRSEWPDAVLCANDTLAVYASLALDKLHLSAPEDVLITGFDYIHLGRHFCPSIASVDHRYAEFANRTVEILRQIFNQEEVKYDKVVRCGFVPGESCGCGQYRHEEQMRRNDARLAVLKTQTQDFLRGRIQITADRVLATSQFSGLIENLQDLYYSTDGREGSSFYILMDPQFPNLAYEELSQMPEFTFPPVLKCVVGKYESRPVASEFCTTKDLIPDYVPTGQNHMYVFMPIYMEKYVCGYMIMVDHPDYFVDKYFREFIRNYNNVLVSFCQNMKLHALNLKLQEIMQRDVLTNVRNRSSYEGYVQMLEEQFKNGSQTPFAVIVFDINDLKLINDSLGHEAGDVYIQNCCLFICKTFKHSPIFRIGGDEFVAIVSNEDFEKRKELVQTFKKGMEEIARTKFAPQERLSIALGMAEYDEAIQKGFKEMFHLADERMYENKKVMKNGRVR